jgi:hypothetical protein
MVITIIAEPRSGSTNLTNWFCFNKKFTTLFIPSDPKSKWYKTVSPGEYKFNTDHLIIKEDYYQYKNYDDLINICDKVILLYRENVQEQIDSWINAKTTNNWDRGWVYKNIKNDEETFFFKKLKKSFKEDYLDKDYFKISYEELYFNNGFQKIVDYLRLDCVKNENFPVGKKYRLIVPETKNII